MDSQVFKNAIQHVHHQWLGKFLQLNADGKYGIDLAGDCVGIEVKARHREYAWHGWTLASYQYNDFPRDNPTLELYWAFILYNLTIPIENLPLPDKNLARRVREREAWIQPWNFADALPISTPRTGPYKYARPRHVLKAKNYHTITKNSPREPYPRAKARGICGLSLLKANSSELKISRTKVRSIRPARFSIKIKGGTLHVPKGTYLEQRVNDILEGEEIVPF